jgi:site-specific DNA recombinase
MMIDMPIPKSKCFIYLRRSQDREDRQALSIPKQDRQVKQIIADNKFSPIYLPAEDESAKKPGRTIFNDMVRRIEDGEARYVAVWHISRLSRNPIDGGRVIYLLDTGKLLAICTPTRIYRNTPDDKAFLAIELAFAKKNNDDLSEQVKESYVIKRQRGEYPGPAFLGYINVIVRPGVRNIAPDPVEGPKLYDVLVYASTGMYTLDEVWKYAQDRGLKSPRNLDKLIAKTTLENALQRRDYTGVFKRGGPEWIKGSYKPLISVEQFDQIQIAMGWAKQRRNYSTKGAFYAYKGIPRCGTCSMNITAYTKPKILATTGELASYTFYVCTKKSKTVDCKEPQLAEHELTDVIKTEMSNYEITEADGETCKLLVQNVYEDYMKSQDRYSDVWRHDQQEAKKALDVLDDKLEHGVITDERYQLRAAKHQSRVVRTTKLLNGSSQDAERWLELCNETFSGVTNIGEVFEVANDEERRQLMLYLGTNWTLSNKKVALTPREPLNVFYKNGPKTDWRA